MIITSQLFLFIFLRSFLDMIFRQRLKSFVWSFWQGIGGEASCIGGHHGLLGEEKVTALARMRGSPHIGKNCWKKHENSNGRISSPIYFESLYVMAMLFFNLVLSWTALKCAYEEWWIDSSSKSNMDHATHNFKAKNSPKIFEISPPVRRKGWNNVNFLL